jgi:hypothetical protein
MEKIQEGPQEMRWNYLPRSYALENTLKRRSRTRWYRSPGPFWGEVRWCDFFFGAGNTWAPQVRFSPKFHSCERDFNALSGWGAGSRVPRLREPFVYYLVARRVVVR